MTDLGSTISTSATVTATGVPFRTLDATVAQAIGPHGEHVVNLDKLKSACRRVG